MAYANLAEMTENSSFNQLTPMLSRLAERYTKTPGIADRELVMELEHAISLRIASEQTAETSGERRMLEAINAKDAELLARLVQLDQSHELAVNPNTVLITGVRVGLGVGVSGTIAQRQGQTASYSCSPVHYCVRTRDHQIPLLEALLAGGGSGGRRINLNARDSEGNTPLHFAAAFGCADVIDWLQRHGADPTVQNRLGDTPLHVAVKARRANSARAVLSDPRKWEAKRICNNDMKTPEELGLDALLEQPEGEERAATPLGGQELEEDATDFRTGDVTDASVGGAGELELVLSWENANDLDLHLQCPNGEHIFYKHKKAQCGGELSSGREVTIAWNERGNPLVDGTGNQKVTPPLGNSLERIHWPRGLEPPPGVYQVAVHLFGIHTLQAGQQVPKETMKSAAQTPYYLAIRVRGKIVWEYRGMVLSSKEKQIVREFEWPWDEAYECTRPIQVHSFMSFTGRGQGFDVPQFVNEFSLEGGMVAPRPPRQFVRAPPRRVIVSIGPRKGRHHHKNSDCSIM